ncbi:MAG: GyrI-like domain-containing protein [Euryarchaeota archaeon]|nr:GyrI-like domain-containing protein [Euryarchaeota archaeon]
MPEIVVKKREATKIAYVEHTGPYDKIPFDVYIGKLYGFAKENKVMPGFHPFAMYPDDPKVTPPEKLKSEIAITLKGEAVPSKGVKVKILPEMEVAVIKHKAPGTEFPETYRKVMEWVAANGYECSGPCLEIYTKKPTVEGAKTIIYANIQVPIRKKK